MAEGSSRTLSVEEITQIYYQKIREATARYEAELRAATAEYEDGLFAANQRTLEAFKKATLELS